MPKLMFISILILLYQITYSQSDWQVYQAVWDTHYWEEVDNGDNDNGDEPWH